MEGGHWRAAATMDFPLLACSVARMIVDRLSLLLGIAIAAVHAPAAKACMVSDGFAAIIHDELPTPLPEDTFVAEVSVEAGQADDLFGAGLKARVLRRFQGEDRGPVIVLKKSFWTSCSQPFDNGTRGLIVAVPRGSQSGLLVVDPIEVSRSEKHRLRNGYTVSTALRSGRFDTDKLLKDIERANRPKR